MSCTHNCIARGEIDDYCLSHDCHREKYTGIPADADIKWLVSQINFKVMSHEEKERSIERAIEKTLAKRKKQNNTM